MSLLTVMAGVAAVEAIDEATGVRATLKWPNDVVVEAPGAPTRKLAGILAEGVMLGPRLSAVVVGLGVNLRPSAYPPEIAARAVALETLAGRAVDPDGVLVALLGALVAAPPRPGRARGRAGAPRHVAGVVAERHGRAHPLAAAGAGLRGDHGRRRRDRCPAGADARRRGPARRGRGGVGVSAAMPAGEYCRAIEAYLCRENGGHLVRIVGPAFQVVAAWHAAGIPFAIVKQGIDRTLARDRAKPAGPVRRPVRVEFCEADVQDAFATWRRAVGVGMAGADDEASRAGARGRCRATRRGRAACRTRPLAGGARRSRDAAPDAGAARARPVRAGGSVRGPGGDGGGARHPGSPAG